MRSAGKLSAAENILTAQECRCARAALNWSKETLAFRANVSLWTISRFENGHSRFWPTTASHIVEALRDGGVLIGRENGFSVIKFIPAITGRLRRPKTEKAKPGPSTGPG